MRRHAQVEETIAHHAADFFARNVPHGALLTVTRAEMTDDYKNITVFFSVLPATHEKEVLAFSKRERSAFRDYLKEHTALHPVPTIDFEIDLGEKNRQRVDELTRK